jgi:hypothetical protein
MLELVRSSFHKLISSRRLPSFAGNGLPERMRSISFALLGLTAAAGLAMVALFAQPGFPVLSPAPLPDEPSATEAVAQAESLPLRRHSAAVLPARPAAADQGGAASVIGSPTESRSGPAGGSEGGQPSSAEADVPAPVSAPEPSGGNGDGGGSEVGPRGALAPPPEPTPAQPPAATATPASPTAPASAVPPAGPKPEAIASVPKPEPAPAPGNSASAAAAEHASERGIEASVGHGPPPGPAATAASPAPESTPSPDDGDGLAKGHYK